jgi:pyruvate dehydrogenase E1 component beta subunit
MVPVPEIQFLGFTYQGFHQLAGQIARLRFRSHGRFEMPVTIRAPFGGGVRTPELHSDSLEGQLANLPGLKVVAPATAPDMAGLLASAIRDPDPVLVLEPLRGYRGVRGEVPDDVDHLVPLGEARVAREGDDVAVIAWSYQLQVAMRAAEELAEEGISCHVVDLRSLVPLDLAAVGAAVERCGRLVVLEEAAPTGGFAGEIIATACEEAFWSLEAPPVRVSGYDAPYPMGMLEDRYVPDADRVAAAIRRLAEVAP